jgi:iron-sulfur cluster repair protein YtfE (RIC family)
MTQLSITHLLREHREIEEAFAPLEALLETETATKSWTPELAAAFSTFAAKFTECAIAHIRKEEEILFPALEGFLPREVGPLAVLRGEHHELRQHFEKLRTTSAAMAAWDATPATLQTFLQHGRTLAQLMRDHIYKEDRILFPMVARFLSGVRDAYLLREMETGSEGETGSAPATAGSK